MEHLRSESRFSMHSFLEDEKNTTTYPTRRDDTVHKINTEKSSNKNLLQQDTKEKWQNICTSCTCVKVQGRLWELWFLTGREAASNVANSWRENDFLSRGKSCYSLDNGGTLGVVSLGYMGLIIKSTISRAPPPPFSPRDAIFHLAKMY